MSLFLSARPGWAAGRSVLVGAAGLALAFAPMLAHADDAAACGAPADAAPPSAGDQPSPHEGGLFDRDLLSGNWGGLRSRLEDSGVQLGLNYIGEGLANTSGGIRRGAIYEDRVELTATVDLCKLVGWTGATFHANAYRIDGRGLSANNLGNLLTASGNEATRSTRLFDLWLQQALGPFELRLGQLAADDEFAISQYAATFVNSTFGWPGILATDLPSGGPAYPLATPGIRLKWTASDQLTVMAGVFNGDPAGPGAGDPQRRDASGTSFRLNDAPFAIVEAAYSVNQGKDAAGLPGTYKLGAWLHGGRFADQHTDSRGLSLSDPASSGVPQSHNGNYGLYGIVDQMLWQPPAPPKSDDAKGDDQSSNQGLGVFARLGGAPSDRNLIDLYADAGVTYTGIFKADDVLGFAIATARISSGARDFDRELQHSGVPGHPLRDAETALELTYQMKLAPWWLVQPDMQYIIHPGGGIPNPLTPTASTSLGDALVLGLRTSISF